MADLIQIDAAGVEVAYAGPDGLSIQAAGVEVAYKVTDPITDVMVIAAGVEVAYLLEEAPPSGSGRTFPVPPTNRVLQSQAGKRVFPVVIT